MNKSAINKYAVWARNELIARVAQKADQYGITEAEIISASEDSIYGRLLTPIEKKQRTALIERIKTKGYKQVIEEVAYTWFNRFTAIRFMEANGYLPSHVRVFTDEENRFAPQILAEAIHLDMPGLNMDKVFELKQANKTEELYKYLIITQCNAFSEILPGMFQKIEDYTELLLPDNLLREGSVIEQMITLIPEEDWTDQIQIIGWLYQFYNGEKKEEVFAALKRSVKITKENIPAATQLFTPDWIVRYMVDNSLGRLWLEGHPSSAIRTTCNYFLDEPVQSEKIKASLEGIRSEYSTITPEQIKCIDPCAGSGHILVYLFDLLQSIYEDFGYSKRDAVRSIIENNLYGLDIDERAAQLAYFAVMMKARQYDSRFFSRKDAEGHLDVPQPHVHAIVDGNHISSFTVESFAEENNELKKNVELLIRSLTEAKEYGALLDLPEIDYDLIFDRLNQVQEEGNMISSIILQDLLPILKIAKIMSQKYDVVVTNPPYAGRRHLNNKVCDFLDKMYPDGKMDLFSAFILKNINMTKPNGFTGFMTPFVWLYLSSYSQLRQKVLQDTTIASYVQPEETSFKDAAVSLCSFVVRKHSGDYRAKYIRFNDVTDMDKQAEILREISAGKNTAYEYATNQSVFLSYPDQRMIYWENEAFQRTFQTGQKLDEVCQPRQGMATTNNDLFLRLWFETQLSKIGFGYRNEDEAEASQLKWFPYNKGGGFRKWYGNNEYVVNYEYRGKTICDYIDNTPGARVGSNGRVINRQFFFNRSITWSDICGSNFAARSCPNGFIFDVKGSSAFVSPKLYDYIIAFLNTKVNVSLLNGLNPSVTTQVGDLKQLPFIFDESKMPSISELVEDSVMLSKNDWDSFETSWDFARHPMCPSARMKKEQEISQFATSRMEKFGRIAWHYNNWENQCEARFNQLKANEEELNKIFIEIYGLQENIDPSVAPKDVTVSKANLARDIRSFISYAVGCMFGRYSLDIDGIAHAGGEWNDNNYSTFQADKDNVLPICDDEYFEDDIVGKFVKFVEVVYGKDSLEANLKFIADALGGNGSPRDVIRSYFLNDFYADHLKIYQKRPIYWQFDSGKKNGFKCLIYMHRYQPDTIARIRTDYVHEQQARYRTAIADLEQRIQVATTSERVKLTKLLQKLKDQETEIRLFEEKIHHLADQMIRIDLDDGVKHNYEIFGDVLTKLK